MRLIHLARYRNPDGTTTKKEDRALKEVGNNWEVVLQSEDHLIQIFADNLDDDFTLLCNVHLPELPHDIDFILVGPKGVWVFELFYTEGLFKADGERWLIFNNRANRLKRCKPNPIEQATLATNRLNALFESQLGAQEMKAPWVSPAVILVNPKTIVQTTEAVTFSILRAEQVYDVAARDLKKFDDVISAEEAQAVITLIQETHKHTPSLPPQRKVFTRQEKRYRGMSANQWTVLFPIISINLCLIIAFVGYLLYSDFDILAVTINGWLKRLLLTP